MTGWPFPGRWRQIDRAKRVAQEYRDALLGHDPELCERIDAAMVDAGEPWVVPQIATAKPHDFVTVPEAAELVGRSVQWVYAWVAEDRDQRMIKDKERNLITVNVAAIQEAAASAPR